MAKYAYHQIDQNQQPIIDALEAAGVAVCRLGRPVDLLCGYAGRTYLLEVKMGKGKLRPKQATFILGWRGHVAVVRTANEALQACGVLNV